MVPFSVLDLSPILEGSGPEQSFRNSLDLARRAEAAGYTRYWLAEHHNMPGIASSATAVVIGHIAAGTRTIRVGSGGIMLPNHAPLIIAEQFGTLATLYGDRIDLGLGRAPGTDLGTARALRRGMDGPDSFPQDVVDLIAYLDEPAPGQAVRAIPGAGTKVPVWILGSSLYGAQLAAHLGLPYAFASHFAPAALEEAAEIYRRSFNPSSHLDAPYFMLAVNCFAADTDAEGRVLKSSMQQSMVNLRTGRPTPLPRAIDNIEDRIGPGGMAMVDQILSVSVEGTAESVRASLERLIARYQPDEILFNGQIHDHAARLRSFEIAAQAMTSLGVRPAAE
ncbi:MAG: LLM class flavin-dependent oxidoreductase [Pseudomonadota bacterium]